MCDSTPTALYSLPLSIAYCSLFPFPCPISSFSPGHFSSSEQQRMRSRDAHGEQSTRRTSQLAPVERLRVTITECRPPPRSSGLTFRYPIPVALTTSDTRPLHAKCRAMSPNRRSGQKHLLYKRCCRPTMPQSPTRAFVLLPSCDIDYRSRRQRLTSIRIDSRAADDRPLTDLDHDFPPGGTQTVVTA